MHLHPSTLCAGNICEQNKNTRRAWTGSIVQEKKTVQKKSTGKKKSAVQVTPVRQDPQDVPGKKTNDAVLRTSGAPSVSRSDDEESDVDFGASYNDSEIEIPSSDEDDELNVLSKRPIGRKKAKVIDKKKEAKYEK